jgi:hypothetical protein
MLKLRTSEEFAIWFAALDQPTAEDVAATLEVIVQLAPVREPPGSSEWLTWYEDPSVSGRLRDLAPLQHPYAPVDESVARFVRQWGEFNGYARRAIKHLESPAFVARLGQLDEASATTVASAVARIRTATTRRALAVSDKYLRLRRFVSEPATPRAQAALFALADVQEIRDAYFAALAAAGFDVSDAPVRSPALREIGLRAPPPGVRLLYGIDPAGDRGLVVLGERFDRSFYGDSVRLAEQKWREFLEAGAQERVSL